VRLLGHFEDDNVIYIVQEICAKVSKPPQETWQSNAADLAVSTLL
jgi:hypothetical protein